MEKLNDRTAKALKPKATRYPVLDKDVRGLAWRVAPSGLKTWCFYYRRQSDGLKRNVTLGRFPDFGVDDARRWAREQSAAVARGDDPAGTKRARKEAETFAALAVQWVWRHARPNKRRITVKRDVQMLRKHILPEIGAMKAQEVTKRDLVRMLDAVATKADARLKTGKASGRKMTHQPNRVYELVHSIFRWGVGRDILKFNPMSGLAKPIKKEKSRERALSTDELRTLWQALEQAPAWRASFKRRSGDIPIRRNTALAIQLALVTAQRIGEITAMTAAQTELDLNDTAPMWTIPGDRTKNGQPHRVPLSPLAVSIIREALQRSPSAHWVFGSPTGKGPIAPTAPIKSIERALPVLGLAPFRVHDLRRTAATQMAESGIFPHTLSLVLNHISAFKSNVTNEVYNRHSYDREKRQALCAWAEKLASIIEGRQSTNVIALHLEQAIAEPR